MVVLVQQRLSIIFISSKEGWCGESHTLPYPGYATAETSATRFVAVDLQLAHPNSSLLLLLLHLLGAVLVVASIC